MVKFTEYDFKKPLVPGAEIEKESVTQAPRLLKAPAPTAVSPINVVAVTLYVDTQIIRWLTLNITWIIHDKIRKSSCHAKKGGAFAVKNKKL